MNVDHSAEQRTVRGDHCCMLKSGVLFKRETHTCTCPRKHAHSLTTKRNYPIFIPDFGSSHFLRIENSLTSNTTSLWILPCSQASSLSRSPLVCYNSLLFVLLLLFFPAKEPGTTKDGRMKKGKSDMWRKPQCFLIFSRQRGGPELSFPYADFRLVRPAPAITYILTPILTTDSTPNYHLPSMTILQAHPQVQQSCYLKTRQRPTTTTSAAFETL